MYIFVYIYTYIYLHRYVYIEIYNCMNAYSHEKPYLPPPTPSYSVGI